MGNGMIKKLGQVLAIIWITLPMIVSCARKPQQFYDNGVSDDEYMSIARMHLVDLKYELSNRC